MKNLSITALALATFMVVPGISQAATVSFDTDDKDAVSTSEIGGHTTNGADMDGMRVTAFFDQGITQSARFTADGSSSGIARHDGFSLSFDGRSTFSTPFVLKATQGRLQSLKIDGVSGDTIFDIVGSSTGTAGSANGRLFSTTSDKSGNVAVTFSRPVSLSQETHAGDLYAAMMVDFGGIGGLAAGETFSFIQDTDNTAIAGDLTPAIAAVPLPAGLLLMINAIGALTALSRYKRQRAQK